MLYWVSLRLVSFMLSIAKRTTINSYRHAESRYAELRNAECRGDYAECCYAECHCSDCRGACRRPKRKTIRLPDLPAKYRLGSKHFAAIKRTSLLRKSVTQQQKSFFFNGAWTGSVVGLCRHQGKTYKTIKFGISISFKNWNSMLQH